MPVVPPKVRGVAAREDSRQALQSRPASAQVAESQAALARRNLGSLKSGNSYKAARKFVYDFVYATLRATLRYTTQAANQR